MEIYTVTMFQGESKQRVGNCKDIPHIWDNDTKAANLADKASANSTAFFKWLGE
jgi:hypothetical protein